MKNNFVSSSSSSSSSLFDNAEKIFGFFHQLNEETLVLAF